jgi:hypothetical protein
MRQYTPINEFKLKSKEAKEFLVMAKKMRGFSVENIRVHPNVFNELMDSISPSVRDYYIDGIPFEGKLLVRK